MNFANSLLELWQTTGIYGFLQAGGWGNVVMIGVGLLLIWLAIKKGFEPLLLIPIGFGAVLSNIPFAEIASHTVQLVGDDGHVIVDVFGGFIGQFYDMGIASGLFPLLIFMGVGAMTDFGPLLANPKTLLLGAAAQFGIFFALFGTVLLERIPGSASSAVRTARQPSLQRPDWLLATWAPSPWPPTPTWPWYPSSSPPL